MAYSRGAPSVFDVWARTTGDESWAWSKLVHYFNKVGLLFAEDSFLEHVLTIAGWPGYTLSQTAKQGSDDSNA